jgi:hypothetical protein
MAIVKITDLPDATVPLSYAELAPIVQSGVTKKVALSDVFSIKVANFSGTGSQVQFFLPANTSENATSIYISGVYQQKNTYSVSTNAITFSQAPPAGASIEVTYA